MDDADASLEPTDGASSPGSRPRDTLRRLTRRLTRRLARPNTWQVALLAALAYVPALASSPGRMLGDTKLYLYLDPSRLTGDALYSWDSRQFAGWVPHQTVAYLWPSGPFYSFFDWIGVPDWIAHRLWIATLMFLAGLGARWAAKVLGISATGALVAAVFYQCSPYLLPYISRTSTMLLPWVGLGWLVGLTARAACATGWARWRAVALFGLVMVTISAVNATAIMMIAPAPVLWLLHAAWERTISWRRAGMVAVQIGAVSVLVSGWWIAMLTIQSTYGADVLGYSETLEAVSLTSSGPEVVRALGYWLFYVRDPWGFTTTASFDYMASGRVIAVSFLVLGVGLVGLVATRWAARRFAVLLVVAGVVLAVGVHPIDDASPLMSFFADNSRSSISLAWRSSTRAMPLSVLGLALGAGALTTAIRRTEWSRRFQLRRLVPVALALLAIVNLPALTDRRLVDVAIQREQDVPAAWTDAAAYLDGLPAGYRVMQIPGQEFGAFRWGYTSDPPLPGLSDRPLVTRDLLPLGSASAMDLLYAFDDRFQDGTAEIESVAAIARLFAADTIWLPNDVAFDRYRTPRPELTEALFATAATGDGLGATTAFGDPQPNVPVLVMVDEDSIANALVGSALPPVELVAVEDPLPVVRTKTAVVILAGSGDGVVDAAAAGLLDGSELLRYAADAGVDADTISTADRVIVTDSNRDRAHHWHSSQDVWGFTEDGNDGQGVLVEDTSDQRIPVFTDEEPADRTAAQQRGGTRATASGYGEPFAYRPESRPAMAVDGDIATAWVVADRFEAVGEYMRVEADTAFASIRLVQPQDRRNRWITSVTVTDASGTYGVDLDETSRTPEGQTIVLRQPSTTVTITIAATAHSADAVLNALDAVGFAEVATDAGPTDEVVRVPSNVLPSVRADQALDIVLSRLRTRETNRWRSDPEPVMVRAFDLATDREMTLDVTARVDLRASDSILAGLLGWTGTTADRRLTGVAAAGGWAATDGDVASAWVSPFGPAEGSTVTIPLATPLSPGGTSISITQPTGTFNTITEIAVTDDAGTVRTFAVPAPDASGASVVAVDGLSGSTLHLTVTATTAVTTTDRRYAEQVLLPVAIAEVSAAEIAPRALPDTISAKCRRDVLTLDGEPVPVTVSGSVADLFAGQPATVTLCDGTAADLSAGEHIVRSAPGTGTGIDIDRVVFSGPTSAATPESEAGAATVTLVDNGRTERSVEVAPCPTGCWLVFGEGYNLGWTASTGDGSLGQQASVDGGFNGWYLPPSDQARTVTFTWQGQTRLTVGIALTATASAACLAVIVVAARRRRRRGPAAADASVVVAADSIPRLVALRIPAPDEDWRRPFGRAAVTTMAALVGGALLINPRWGVVCAVFAALCGFVLRRSQVVGVVAVAMMGTIALVMLRRFLALKPFVNAGWPGVFEDLHRPTMAVIVLLGATVIARPRRSPR